MDFNGHKKLTEPLKFKLDGSENTKNMNMKNEKDSNQKSCCRIACDK